MPTWLALIVLGLIGYGISLTPPVASTGWQTFCRWVGGVLVLVGVVLLVLLILKVPLPG